jgi:hypothetical protein
LNPRIVGRALSGLTKASAPYSVARRASSARACRSCASRSRPATLPVREDVEAGRDEPAEQRRAIAAAVEDDGDPALPDQLADLLEHGR